MSKLYFLLFFVYSASCIGQQQDSATIRRIYTQVLTNGQSYNDLDYLCNKIGARPSGSIAAQKAVDYTKKLMKEAGADTVYLQEVMVPKWVRGSKEKGYLISGGVKVPVQICALGGSVPTPPGGISAKVVEVKSFEELEKLGEKNIRGKIVFFNRPMDPSLIYTFQAYGGAVKQRSLGAIEASRLGAVGVIVRSMTLSLDDYPHTGAMKYIDSVKAIPAVAISTIGAERLSDAIRKGNDVKVSYTLSCRKEPEAKSYNVVGEIRGSEFPSEVIVCGGHLDSWDLGTGAHDDGAGCMQSLEVIRTFKKLQIKPRRTIRIVMFMNEEFGLKGGKKYGELSKESKTNHIAAIESDAGGFSPRGFSCGMKDKEFNKILGWKGLLSPYGLCEFTRGGGGADISPLEEEGVPVMELRPDSQRYFDVHHAATDVFMNVNKRELLLGSAALSSMIYLISEHGL